MELRREHPEALAGFETAPPRRVRAWTAFALALWLAAFALDWMARLVSFRWQDEWLARPPPPPAAAAAAASQWTVPDQTGAGLTQMIPVSRIAARYAEFHPGYVSHRDAFGYGNAPLPEGARHRVVMLGDSFMLSLGTQNVAQALAGIGGIEVYNHAKPGAGPFRELGKFILADRFDPRPDVVVWNLSGRELGAPLFLRQPVEAWFQKIDVWDAYQRAEAKPHVRWGQLAPAMLRKAWPNTSLLAYAGRQLWARVKLAVLREWPRDVLGAEDPQFGPMLFYRENLRVLPQLGPGENAQGIVRMVAQVAEGFRGRGQVLVVLLVPEKEQIHAAALPAGDQIELAVGPALFAEIDAGLEAVGTPVVDLMPVFQQATAQGRRLYWRDDTHWNDAGIQLAAEELWHAVEPLLK